MLLGRFEMSCFFCLAFGLVEVLHSILLAFVYIHKMQPSILPSIQFCYRSESKFVEETSIHSIHFSQAPTIIPH